MFWFSWLKFGVYVFELKYQSRWHDVKWNNDNGNEILNMKYVSEIALNDIVL